MKPLAAVLAAVLLFACARQPGEKMPPFALVDQSGTTVRSESLRGRVLVVSFVFTTCVEACPLVTAQLARVQLGDGAAVEAHRAGGRLFEAIQAAQQGRLAGARRADERQGAAARSQKPVKVQGFPDEQRDAPGRIRTCDPRIRRRELSQLVMRD